MIGVVEVVREHPDTTAQLIGAGGAVLAALLSAIAAFITGRNRREVQSQGGRIDAIDHAVNGSDGGPTLREHTEAIADAVGAETAGGDVHAQRWHPRS